jgi:acetyl esterase
MRRQARRRGAVQASHASKAVKEKVRDTPRPIRRPRESLYSIVLDSIFDGKAPRAIADRMTKIDLAGRLDPEMAAALAESRRLQDEIVAKRGAIAPEDLAGQRAAYEHERAFWNSLKPELSAVEETSILGPGGAVCCRIYRPGTTRPAPALLYLHGGGWVLGSLDTHDRIMRLLAQKSGAVVVGADYRLAPEHKFPAAHEDALAVLRHLIHLGAAWGIDGARLAVGGDSAGANLALASCLCLNPEERRSIRLQLLYYGAYGLLDSASMRSFANDLDGVSKGDMERYRAYLIRTSADLADIRLDCLSADLGGLPRSFITAGGLDPLLDDSRALAALMTEAGVPNELVIYPGVLHGFLHYSGVVGKAMQALDAGAAALIRGLS